jgi:GH24 family phage-related lysozyme (muramidase)
VSTYSEDILDFIRKEEGYAGMSVVTVSKRHPSTSSDYGAYYDTRDYLTTGFGSLVSKAPRGSAEEKADIEKWKRANGNIDPFSMTINQANAVLPNDVTRNLQRAMNQINAGREDKIEFEALPDPVKKAVVSISYNTGHVGNNTGKAIAKAMDTKNKADWNVVADYFDKWHGAKTDKQEKGVLNRRKLEAELIRSVVGIESDTDSEFMPEENESDLTTPTESVQSREPASEIPAQVITEPTPRVPSPFESTQNQTHMKQLELQKQQQEIDDARPALSGIQDFGKHMLNAFRTENITAIAGNKIVQQAAGFVPENTRDPKFDPEKQVPEYYERIAGIPPETLKKLLEDSDNAEMLQYRINEYREEERTRMEVIEYMSENPISGFIGLGVASVLDVTTLIPVGKVAKIKRLADAAKTLSHTQRAVGGAIGVNLTQDLIQEAALIGASDIRKFEDGDMIYGAVGAVVLGGAAGKLAAKSTESKFLKLADKYHAEKNLMQSELILQQAKAKRMSPKVIAELETLNKVATQEHTRLAMAKAMDKLAQDQAAIRRGLIDNAKLEAVAAQEAYIKTVDDQIAMLPPSKVQQVLDTAKEELSSLKQKMQPEINRLKQVEKELRGKIKKWESNKTPNSIEKPRYVANLKNRLQSVEAELKTANAEMKKSKKDIERKKTKGVRDAKKQPDPRDLEIKRLQDTKKEHAKLVRSTYDQKVRRLEANDHPELQILDQLPALQKAADDLGLGVKFDSVDAMDEFLGLNFVDSTHKSAGAAAVKYTGLAKKGSVSAYWGRIPEGTGQVLARALTERNLNPVAGLSSHSINKNSAYAKLVRNSRMNEMLSTESAFGRTILNKSALRHSDNEIAAAFYDLFAPDNAGRSGASTLGAFEKQQQISNIFGGKYREKMFEGIRDLAELSKNDKALSRDLELTDANRFLMTKEVYFQEKVSKLVRQEADSAGFARANYKPETADVIERMVREQDTVNKALMKRAQEAEVKFSDEVYLTDKDTGWFSRSWDNNKVREFTTKHGDGKLIELVEVSMEKHLVKNSVELTDGLRASLKAEAKKFAYGLRNVDLEVNKAAKVSMADYLDTLITREIDGIDTDVLIKERDALRERGVNEKKKQFAKRKPLDLQGSVKLDDGTEFSMMDLLEENMFESQVNYIEQMSARIAAAELGIKDISDLDTLVQTAYEMELARGKKDTAEFIRRAMSQDVQSFKYGSLATETTGDKAFDRMLRFAKKTQYARLMQYSGINSIAELGTLVPEAGYKALSEAISGEVVPLVRALLTAGLTGKEFRNVMSDQLSSITGVGIESLAFDSLVSSSRALAQSKVGKIGERIVDNAAKMTKRTSAHVETTLRRVGMNALAIDFGNLALGRKGLDSMWGGMSKRNMIELGFAERLPSGEFKISKTWTDIQDSIRKFARDGEGRLAVESGESIKDFGIDNWDLETRRAFGDALTLKSNTIFVNPDPTTMKLWHSTPVGSIVNQFRTFANNATSKVAARNVINAVEGLKAGEVTEASKFAQKMFWSAALGKLSYMLYGAINEAGREDYAERMEKYMSVTEFRDWTRALGRSSAITGLDGPLDTALGLAGIDPLFDVSTVGQSRNRLDLLNTPVGQIGTNAAQALDGLSEGDLEKTGGALLRLSPIRRQIGINQLLNSMGID